MEPAALLARFGGDEFAILVNRVAGADEAVDIAERVGAALELPFEVDGHEIVTSASIGIVARPPDGEPATALLRFADVAMYDAKARGPGRHSLFQPGMSEAAVVRLAGAVDLRRALAAGDFTAYVQPKIALDSGECTGFEALARWEHATRGPISPLEFTELAEETGLIVQLGRLVLRQACHLARAWQLEFPRHRTPRVCVNLSATEFQRPDLLDSLALIPAEEELEPRYLELEITESAVMADVASTEAVKNELKYLGVRLAIDDFGTGYSSLAYLKRFPADVLKIDRAFVTGLCADGKDAKLAGTMIAIGHALDMDVVAEGVETRAQQELLARMNCDIGQGYFFARPLPAAEATNFLRENLERPAEALDAVRAAIG